MVKNLRGCIVLVGIFSMLFEACTRNDISFGTLPDNSFANVVFTDTVSPVLSTVVLDSFVTNNTSSFLVGKYKDPFLGIVTAKPFFQLTVPLTVPTIPTSSVYDSAVFYIHPNKYYYGDTTRPQTITVNELDQYLNYTSNVSIYNTSNFAIKSTPIGSRTLKIRPNADDSISIPVADAKGRELFDKLQTISTDISSDANFQNYFKGVSLSVGPDDTTAVFGLGGADTSIFMRVYYHTTIPYLQNLYTDFSLKVTSYSFNQITTDRTGTPLFSTAPGIKEFTSDQTNHVAYSQYGAGVLLKVTFPTLKGILSTDKIVELQKAELVIKPVANTFDFNKFQLPTSLLVYQTDATNLQGASLNSDVPLTSDEIYGINTYYKFDVTAFINNLLTGTGNQDQGMFLLSNAATANVTRAIAGDGTQPLYNTQLLITAIVINQK